MVEAVAVQGLSKTFTIYNKLLSVRDRMVIMDFSGGQIASAQKQFFSWRETWHVDAGEDKLRLRRKLLALMPRWLVDGDLGEFSIRRKWAFFRRRYRIIGGPFDGADLQGNLTDLRMEVTRANKPVLRTRGFVLSMRDRHEVEVFDESPGGVLFAITTMVALLADRRADKEGEN